MSLQSLLEMSSSSGVIKQGVSEERLRKNLTKLRDRISFYREYPDLFIDEIKGPNCKFKFRLSQRIFLRIVMRHKYVYAVFPRGFSKSFIAVMALMLKAILFPNSFLFVTTGGKEQAASITISKVEEICRLIPALNKEINWSRGKTVKGKNNVKYIFKNGSYIDILAAAESSRGQRRTGGVMEEAILIDGAALNEIIIPTTNVDRNLPNGTTDPNEVVNQSQTYITTAGWKNSFPYTKLIETLINSILFPNQYMVLGGNYELAILEGAAKEDMIEKMKLEGSYDDTSFDREYNSLWSGDAQNAFFSSDGYEKCRQLLQPEYEYSGRTSKHAYYILGVDVGRFDCTTEVCVFKVTPQAQGTSIKSLVNIYTYEAEHFEEQAIKIKKLYYAYKCRIVALDGNGVGAGLVDYMVKPQIDPETGEVLPDFGVENDEDGKYKQYRTNDTERDALYIIKANAPINSEAYTYVKTQLGSRKIKLLIDERAATTKLMDTKQGQNMTPEERASYLLPFVETTILKNQLLNLVQENEGVNIILKQHNKGIGKDKFSAFMYGLYYIKQEEDKKKKYKSRDLSKFMFFS